MSVVLRATLRWVIALLAAFPLVVLAPGEALAQIPICGTNQQFLDGFASFDSPNRVEGVRANLTARRGALCDTDQRPDFNFSTSWVLLVGGNGSSGYAQSGYFARYGQPLRYFAEYDADGVGVGANFVRVFDAEVPLGSVHTPWVQYVSGSYNLRLNYDTTILLITPFNPFVNWPQPFSPQFLGETRYQESDMPGTVGARAAYRTVQVQRFDNNSFVNGDYSAPYRGFGSYGLGRYRRQLYDNTAWDIWTQ